jgi:branched-chain amino acid transport system substrate-binding protein
MVVLLVVSACGSGGDAGDAVVDEPTAAADVADDVDAEAPTEDGGDGEGPTGESEAEADGPAVAEPQGDPIRIGAVLGISGRFAFVGGPQQNALLMAEEEMNAEGGIDGRPVEFVIYDDEVDETKTVPLFNRLIGEDDVVAVIGPSITIPALAVAPLAERAQIPNMTLTSRAIWEEEGLEYVYHTTPREEIEVNSLLAFIAEELGAETIAVLYDDQPYGTGNLAYIEQFAPDFGLEVVGTEPVANDETNAVPQLENLRQTDPDALIVWVGDPAASSTARGLEQIGWDVPMVGSSAIAGPSFIELGGAAAEGVYSNGTFNFGDPPPNQAAFLEGYQDRFDSLPTQFAAFAYDAAYALKAAIEAAGGDTSGPAIIEGLNSLTAFEGVTATFNFTAEDHNGLGLDPLFYIVQVVDGQFQVVADTSQLAG